MSAINEAIMANEEYAANFILGELSHKPQKRLAVVTCMDTRINIKEVLGLKTGEANILRNAGAIVTEDVLRSLIISHQQLGMTEVMIINHTRCGATGFKSEEFSDRLYKETGKIAVSPQHFLDFHDIEDNTRKQVLKVRSHPWISDSVTVRGFVYDVKTGEIKEVKV